jgi:antitoxin HicB
MSGISSAGAIVADQLSFSVVLEPQEGGGFTVLVPALPEVVTEGDTEQEALANAEEAIRAVLAYRRDQGLAIPADAHPEIRRPGTLRSIVRQTGLSVEEFRKLL